MIEKGVPQAPKILKLGKPSAVLLAHGFDNLPIEMSVRVLDRKTNKHNFKPTELSDLPNAINNPIAIFESSTDKRNLLVFTEIKKGDKNFIVAVEINKQVGKRLVVNSVRSTYLRNNSQILTSIKNNEGKYYHKEKMIEWLNDQRFRATQTSSNHIAIDNRFNQYANIVNNHQNNISNLELRFQTTNSLQEKVEKQQKVKNDLSNSDNSKFQINTPKAELDTIKSKAQADGTFMKAPNGKPTNLNEKQWLQTRSKSFIEWFGDWETLAELKVNEEKIQKLLDIDNNTSSGIKRETIGKVTEQQAKIIKDAIGIDVSDYKHTIDKSEINHTLNNHGVEKIEASRGQVAISKNDFKLIPQVLNNPDKIEYTGKNEKGLETIKYTKAFNGTTIIIEEVRTGKKELALNTMYKRKTRSEQLKNPPLPTSETTSLDKDTNNLENTVSKVIDENGEPMVVYHGTNVEFTEFKGRRSYFFSSKKNVAKSYRDDYLFKEDLEIGIKENEFNQYKNDVVKNNTPIYEVFLNIKNPKTKDYLGENWLNKPIERDFDFTKDGFISNNIVDGGGIIANTIVVFSPNQIKSATDNVGTFDAGNNDIRFQIADAETSLNEELNNENPKPKSIAKLLKDKLKLNKIKQNAYIFAKNTFYSHGNMGGKIGEELKQYERNKSAIFGTLKAEQHFLTQVVKNIKKDAIKYAKDNKLDNNKVDEARDF